MMKHKKLQTMWNRSNIATGGGFEINTDITEGKYRMLIFILADRFNRKMMTLRSKVISDGSKNNFFCSVLFSYSW
jgi:hypothetical protein